MRRSTWFALGLILALSIPAAAQIGGGFPVEEHATGDITDVFDCSSGNCQSIALGATDLLDLSGCDASSLTEGLLLPQHATDCATGFAEGSVCWDADSDILYIGTGAAFLAIGPGGAAGAGDVTDVFSCATGDCASITMAATDLLDMSGVDASSGTEGLILPQHATACAGGTSEGQACWEADANILHIGDGAGLVDFIPTSAFSGDATVGTTGVVTVADDQHAHTGSTISALAGADITSGTLAHERGGLEADVSAYGGLIRITGGATSNVTDLAGLNTALSTTIADGAHTVDSGGDVTDVFGCATGDCASIALGATDLLDMSGTDASATNEGIILPQHATACAGGTAEGQVCWEADANILHIGDAATIVQFVPTSGFSGDATVSVTGVVTVADDGHAHTTTTISGLATTDITTGTFIHERGGLEADVSAYAGLIRITGGATSNVTDLAGLNTALGSTIADGAHSGGDVTDVFSCSTGDCASITMAATDLLDMSGVDASTATEGLILPQVGDGACSGGTAEGQVCWRADDDTLWVGNGATLTEVGAGGGDVTDVFSCASGDCSSITMAATDLLNMSGVDASSATEGLILPQHATACAGGTAEGQACWEADANILHIGDGAGLVDFIPTSAFSGDATVGTTGVVTVADDQHAHTGSTISGLSATDTTTGTFVHERGGLEDDVSAYAGLVRINAGSTSNVTNLSGLNTALGSNIADGAHSSGDVTKVGTPVNNQVGVWTGDGTLEGDANLTWDASTLAVTGAASVSGSLSSNGGFIATSYARLNNDVNLMLGNSGDARLRYDTAVQNLDTVVLTVPASNNTFLLMQEADAGTNFAPELKTNPTIRIQSADATSIEDFIALEHDQTNGVISVGSGTLSIPGTVLVGGDATFAGGIGAATFTDTASSIVLPANDASALDIGAAALTDLMRFVTSTGADRVVISGPDGPSGPGVASELLAFHVEQGEAQFFETVIFDGAGSASTGTLEFTDSAASILVPDNDTTAFRIGSVGAVDLLAFDTGNDSEQVTVTGYAGTLGFRVDAGTSQFDEAATFSGTTGAITLNGTNATIVVPDNNYNALDIGSTGNTSLLRLDTRNNVELVRVDGYVNQTSFHVDVGDAQFDEALTVTEVATFNGGVTFSSQTTYTIPSTVTVTTNAATVDLSNGDLQVLDMQGSTGDVTVTLSNPATGSWALKIIQGTGVDDIIWPATVDWPGGTAPVITATDDAVDTVSCIWDGAAHLCTFAQDMK